MLTVNHFSDRACAYRKYRVKLLHNVDIISSLTSGKRKAYVFKISYRILLLIEIVRQIERTLCLEL